MKGWAIMKYCIVGRIYDFTLTNCIGYKLLSERGSLLICEASKVGEYIDYKDTSIYDFTEATNKGIKMKGVTEKLIPFFDQQGIRYKRNKTFGAVIVVCILNEGTSNAKVRYESAERQPKIYEVGYKFFVYALEVGQLQAFNATVMRGRIVARKNCLLPRLTT